MVIVSFLLVYTFGLLGNMSIITAVLRDSRLHTPMYFFLKNLCFLDLSYTSVTIPKALATTLQGPGVISYLECVAQLYMFHACFNECFLLTAMAYDQCVAIYRPLLYGTIMNHGWCWPARAGPSTRPSTPSTPSPCPLWAQHSGALLLRHPCSHEALLC